MRNGKPMAAISDHDHPEKDTSGYQAESKSTDIDFMDTDKKKKSDHHSEHGTSGLYGGSKAMDTNSMEIAIRPEEKKAEDHSDSDHDHGASGHHHGASGHHHTHEADVEIERESIENMSKNMQMQEAGTISAENEPPAEEILAEIEIVDEEQKPVRPGKMTPKFDLWYSIAPGDVKVNSNAVKDGLQSRRKSLNVFSDLDLKKDKPDNKIGRLLMREIVHLESNKVTDFSTILELIIHKNCEKVERGFGAKFHAQGGRELELAVSGSAVTNPDDVKEKITKHRIGHVTSRPEKSRFPKLGEPVRVSITTFAGKLYNKLSVKLQL